MKTKSIFLAILMGIVMYGCENQQEERVEYPEARKGDTVDVYFGTEVADPYRWMEDLDSKEVAEWVETQQQLTRSYFEQIPYRNEVEERMTKLWNYPKFDVPFREGDRYFFFKNDGLQNQSVLYMQEDLEAEPEMLLNPNEFSEEGTIALTSLAVSQDGKKLAYGISRSGSDWNEIYVMDINSKEKLDDKIEWVKFSGIAWHKDGFYYSRYPEPKEGEALSGKNEYHKVFYHKLGTPQSEDKMIFEDRDHPLRTMNAQITEDEKYLVIYESESTSGNALYVKDLTEENSKIQLIADGFDHEYAVIDNIDDKLLVKTNEEAPKNKIVLIDPANPSSTNWKTIIPEQENVLQAVSLIGGKIVAEYMKDAASHAVIYSMQGDSVAQMNLPGIGNLYALNGKKNEDMAFYGFTSFTFPTTIYKYNVNKNESEVYRESEMDFDSDAYITEQVFYESKDGTRVPMFLVHKKDLKMDGNNPVLLYGYGGFNVSMEPSFSVSRLIFLEQGGIYAVANLRGGGEYGEEWHKAGTKMQKQNVFDDFIAAAEYMIEKNYTKPEKIAILGGSNGGLLVGACMTQRPDLFGVAVPIVGVMDMLRYQNFTIGWAWASDYGTSKEGKQMFEYLLGYSPLHNIEEGVEYPATLAVTADHDDRVVPSHTFKFMATLQEKGEPKEPYLLRIESKAGHGAGKPTSKIIAEYSDIYSFIMHNLDMQPEFDNQ